MRGDLSEGDANRILAALDAAGIAGRKRSERGARQRYRVDVREDQVPAALEVLTGNGLPPAPTAGFAELYVEPGLVATPHEERARMAAAQAGELSRSIETMPGVIAARVHIALPDPATSQLDSTDPPPRASVLIRHEDGQRPDDQAVAELVSGAIGGMKVKDVSVTSTPVQHVRQADVPQLVSIGPLRVSQASAQSLRTILGGSLALNALLSAVVAAVIFRNRRRPTPHR